MIYKNQYIINRELYYDNSSINLRDRAIQEMFYSLTEELVKNNKFIDEYIGHNYTNVLDLDLNIIKTSEFNEFKTYIEELLKSLNASEAQIEQLNNKLKEL